MRQKIGFAVSIALVACMILSTRIYEVDLPIWRFFGGGKNLDPASLHLSGEFVESNLGTARAPDGTFTVRMLAQQYLFVPACVVVPAAVPVRFRITSADVVHLFTLGDVGFGLKAVPGAVTQVTTEFAKTGEFDAPCREFCGAGHFTMRARVRVVPEQELAAMRPDQRSTCEEP